jgi:hypothetical protein
MFADSSSPARAPTPAFRNGRVGNRLLLLNMPVGETASRGSSVPDRAQGRARRRQRLRHPRARQHRPALAGHLARLLEARRPAAERIPAAPAFPGA